LTLRKHDGAELWLPTMHLSIVTIILIYKVKWVYEDVEKADINGNKMQVLIFE